MAEPLHRIIYSSQPFGYDQGELNGLLVQARRNNRRDGLTGALICRRDIYLQYLEGPKTAVHQTLARISRDDRHANVVVHVDAPAAQRLFADWDMLHDPARSVIWSRDAVADGILDRITAAEALDVFESLAKVATVP